LTADLSSIMLIKTMICMSNCMTQWQCVAH